MRVATRGRRSRTRRREAAEARATTRTPEEQLARLDQRGLRAVRERAKLSKLIDKVIKRVEDARKPTTNAKPSSDPSRSKANKLDRRARKAARKLKRQVGED